MQELERFDLTFMGRKPERTDDALLLRCQGNEYQIHQAGADVLLDKLAEEKTIYRIRAGKCSCPDAVYRKHDCKHIRALKRQHLIEA